MMLAFTCALTGFTAPSGPAALSWAPRRAQHAIAKAEAPVLGGDVAALLAENRANIDALDASVPELTRLRFALAHGAEAPAALAEAVAWRKGAGAPIVDAAAAAVAEATRGGGWDNAPVNAAAPHAASVSKYITTSQIVTSSTSAGDLLFCIRASALDDKSLMSELSVEQLVDFFLYTKEIHALVADARSAATGRLCRVVLCNDLGGLDLGGDASFRNALSASSKAADGLYPELAGPTLLLNLPFFLQALVSLFKPLFPPKVLARLKFEKAPALGRTADLAALLTDAEARAGVLGEIDAMLTA